MTGNDCEFTDASSRTWLLDVSAVEIERVQNQTGFDLCDMFLQNGLEQLNKPVMLVKVLYALLEDQCQARKVSPEDFGRSLRGQSLEAAFDALWRAVADFFPPARARALRTMLTRLHEVDQATLAEQMAALDKGLPFAAGSNLDASAGS